MRSGEEVSALVQTDEGRLAYGLHARIAPFAALGRVVGALRLDVRADAWLYRPRAIRVAPARAPLIIVQGTPGKDESAVDVHALRVTFCSHLLAAGVPLRTAQVAMRHSKPELTARVYSDPQLLDVAGAINALPSFSGTTASKKADVGS